jgi:hypothetical protein
MERLIPSLFFVIHIFGKNYFGWLSKTFRANEIFSEEFKQ